MDCSAAAGFNIASRPHRQPHNTRQQRQPRTEQGIVRRDLRVLFDLRRVERHILRRQARARVLEPREVVRSVGTREKTARDPYLLAVMSFPVPRPKPEELFARLLWLPSLRRTLRGAWHTVQESRCRNGVDTLVGL